MASQIMADLPKERVTAIQPFYVTGVDLCGPVSVTLKIRGKQPVKMYIAVFVCFTSKAVHLETVNDLSTDSFVCSLNRFIGRRGLPKNFVGTANLWSTKNQNHLKDVTASRGITFRFITPRAPHFGGLWEAAVKAAKNLLLRTLGGEKLTHEVLTTLLVYVEAVLNSRSIVAIGEDHSEELALTPGHLLIGSLTEQPEIGESVSKLGYLSRFQKLSSLRAYFWDVWRRDYIRSQQKREADGEGPRTMSPWAR